MKRFVKVMTHLTLLFSVTLSLLPPIAAAQDNEATANTDAGVYRSETLEMVVRAGFGQLALRGWEGAWTPFRVLLANQGAALSGRLVVATKNSNGIGRDFVKAVQLPTGARQLHEITVYLDSSEDVEVRLEASGDTVALVTLNVERQGRGYSQVVVAIVDSDSMTLNNLTNLEMPLGNPRPPFARVTPDNTPQMAQETQESSAPQPSAAANNANPTPANNPNANTTNANTTNANTTNANRAQQNRRRGGPWYSQEPVAQPLVIAPDDMPRDFIAYSAVDVVVLGDAPLSQLSEEQARALKYWVASGGLLIVTGGVDVAGLRACGLAAILPVEVRSTINVPTLTELTDIYGGFDSRDQTLILEAASKSQATTLIGGGDRAIVAESAYGNGLVRFVAYNPKLNPYRSWGEAKYLWTDLLRPAAETKSANYLWGRGRNGNTSVQDSLYQMANIKPTSSTYFLLFLLIYVLAVGPVNYLILRWKKKLDLAWITIPAVVLLFTIVSIVIAQINKEGAAAAMASLVEVYQPEGIQQTRGGFLLRPTSTGKQRVVLDERALYAVDSNYNGPPPTSESTEIEREAGRGNLNVPTTNGAATYFQTRAVSDSPAPLIAAQMDGATAVRVKNLTASPITNAVYVSAAGVSDVFTLAPNEEKQVALNMPQGLSFNDWYTTQLPAESDEHATFLGLSSALSRGTARTNPKVRGFFADEFINNACKTLERPMVMGFLEERAPQIEIAGVAQRQSKTFTVVHL